MDWTTNLIPTKSVARQQIICEKLGGCRGPGVFVRSLVKFVSAALTLISSQVLLSDSSCFSVGTQWECCPGMFSVQCSVQKTWSTWELRAEQETEMTMMMMMRTQPPPPSLLRPLSPHTGLHILEMSHGWTWLGTDREEKLSSLADWLWVILAKVNPAGTPGWPDWKMLIIETNSLSLCLIISTVQSVSESQCPLFRETYSDLTCQLIVSSLTRSAARHVILIIILHSTLQPSPLNVDPRN